MKTTNQMPAGEDGMDREPRNSDLGLALVGGGIAWLFHLLGCILVAEFGCLAGWGEVRFLGVNAVAWILLLVTGVAVAGGVIVTIFSHRLSRQVRGEEGGNALGSGARIFTARTAFITNLIFLCVILIESLPILYFLHDC